MYRLPPAKTIALLICARDQLCKIKFEYVMIHGIACCVYYISATDLQAFLELKNCRWYYLLVFKLYSYSIQFIWAAMHNVQCKLHLGNTLCTLNVCIVAFFSIKWIFRYLNEQKMDFSAGLDLTLCLAIRLIHRNMSHMITFGNSTCISEQQWNSKINPFSLKSLHSNQSGK